MLSNKKNKTLVLRTERGRKRGFSAPPFPHPLPTPWAVPLLELFAHLCICLLQLPTPHPVCSGVGAEKDGQWARHPRSLKSKSGGSHTQAVMLATKAEK